MIIMHDNILNQIVGFCKDKTLRTLRKSISLLPKEKEMYFWIEASSTIILKSLIPENFWKSYGLMEPKRKLESFS